MCSQSIRLSVARFLVLISFVWPFVNTSYFVVDSLVETNFFLVLLAILVFPELLFEDRATLLLLVAVLTVSAIWGTRDAAMRVFIGAAPCVFIFALYRHCVGQGKQLIPFKVSYWALVVFVGFCALQYVNLNLFQVLPDWLTNVLSVIIPRYMDVPYDEFGTRGVQGWASEPSSAAMTCFSFCVVSMQQSPHKRWHILLFFTALTALNKSVYALLFFILLGLACLAYLNKKSRVVLALVPFVVVIAFLISHSARIDELYESFLRYGADQEANRELLRLGQILYPLACFPRVYQPVNIFTIDIQPLGLLPLLIGFGSVAGVMLYWRIIFRTFWLKHARWQMLGLVSVFVFSFLSSPNFIPMIVASAYGMALDTQTIRTPLRVVENSWFSRLIGMFRGQPEVAS